VGAPVAAPYRSTWVDSTGSTGTGETWHDEKTDAWQFRAISHVLWGGTSWKGHVEVVDENTMAWTFAEHAGLIKTMEMTGTSRRR